MNHESYNMTEKEIISKITPVFRRVMEDENLVLTRDLNASHVDAWDSLNHITLVVELEATLNMQFTTDELVKMATVGDLIDCVIQKGHEIK